ncbi:MAG TPA: lysylphosphatidylglycerol synthase transmembrane domain-containing protein [Acidobacteriota bacterium]|nr:lysylphosphatidylglycerol synthase transmembrane domain-containing protein [Acidobacteriota bacterium]
MADKPRRKLNPVTFSLKLIVSLSILALILIFKTSIKEVLNVLKTVNIWWLAVSFSLHGLGLLISAIRWQILVKAQGDSAPLSFLIKSYLVGNFFNTILPSRIGGDVVRIWDGSKYSKTVLKSSAIILVERLSGIVVLFLFAFGAAIFRLDMAQKIPVIWVSLVIGFSGLVAILFFFTPFIEVIINKIPSKGFLKKIIQKTIEFRSTIIFYKTKKSALFKAFVWAFLLQANVILHFFLIGKALHLNIKFIDYLVFIPIVMIIQLIPITINGLGLREGAYIEIFEFYGIAPESAFSFALIDVAFMLIIGVIGAIIYVTRK